LAAVEDDSFMDTTSAAAYLKVSLRELYQFINDRELTAMRSGKRVLVRRDDVVAVGRKRSE
jgi:excisionase family DNA binding protein